MNGDALSTARTLLFVPGDRPDRFARVGGDVVVLDLKRITLELGGERRRDRARGGCPMVIRSAPVGR